MKLLYAFIFVLIVSSHTVYGQAQKITIRSVDSEHMLLVDQEPFMVNGMNWDYFPRGTNYSYSFWKQSDDFIRSALDSEMSLLQNMGVNAVRMYTGVPSRWIEYIHKNYGIYTMLNHSFGRYGLTVDGKWEQHTDYADPAVKALLISETTKLVSEYKNTSGLLLYLLGNENNYGLFWDGAETEEIPIEDRKSTKRASDMYALMNEAVLAMKKESKNHPIAICNGDLLFLDLIVQECPDVDILGTNMYRGKTFTDAFDQVKRNYGKPLLFTEFGSDAFNAVSNAEAQTEQATYLVENWADIYRNAAGNGGAGNSIGGFTFQFSDGWWKYGQTKNLYIHDNNASWPNGGYEFDFVEGENNMNEEWFGICAKGPTDERGLYKLYPRAAYYALQEIHNMDVYGQFRSATDINSYVNGISIANAELKARGDKAALEGMQGGKIRLSRLSAEFTSFNTGGSLITTPDEADPDVISYPDQLGFDHLQSFYVGVEANPAPNMRANVEFNILGNVATNPIDEIFYENRGRPLTVNSNNGPVTLNNNNRLAVYSAEYNWNHKYFDLTGFYRTGHYHWGYEGDFFGLYPEANYGPNIDIYNGTAPSGIEVEGKRALSGFTLALGPELWWGANPAALLKYSKTVGKIDLTGIYHEDLEQRGGIVSSFAVPSPKTRRLTLAAETKLGKLGVQVGGIWAGQPLNGRAYQIVDGDPGNYTIYQNEIDPEDNWGGKIKLTYSSGKINWYGQAGAMGLVANGGADQTQTYTGWRLKDNGSGNQYNVLSGFTYSVGSLQIAPNFLYQTPIVGPVPGDVQAPGRPRNVIDDPFAVRANRETVAGEILFTYDPTPGTWMYEWDNDRSEDAKFAMNLGFVYRHMPTTLDAAIGIFPDGRTTFPFPGGAPAADLWEIHSRLVSKVNSDLGLIANLYGGTAQANGSDQREIQRFGGDLRTIYKKVKLMAGVKVNDWGPFDYHRDFNLTFPQQFVLDISTSLGKQDWFDLPNTNIGVRGTYRTLDQFSPRYCPVENHTVAGGHECDPTAIGYDNGNEWEIRTYIKMNIFNK